MRCLNCGAVYDYSGRVLFRARCSSCDSALHVCLQCRFYDTAAYNSCCESRAERIVEKKRENRCPYFAPAPSAAAAKDESAAAKKSFDDLFS